MIEEITLIQFGKFINKTFGFSDITVFYGGNESGKTTVFDAMLVSLCKVSKTNRLIKEIFRRYGEDFKVHMKTTRTDADLYDINEFMNLYAVRSGDLSFNMSEGNWMERVKANLFSGGIDPDRLVDIFTRLSSDDGKLLHNRELLELEEKKAFLENKLKNLDAQKHKMLECRNDENTLTAGIDGIKNDIRRLAEEKERLENEVILQEKIREKTKLTAVLEDIYRKKELETDFGSMHDLKNDDLKFLNEWEIEQSDLKGKMSYYKELISNLKSEIRSGEKNGKTGIRMDRPDNINRLLSRLDIYRKSPHHKERFFLKIPVFISGLMLSAASLAPAFFLEQNWAFLIAPGLFILTMIISIGRNSVPDAEMESAFISKFKSEAMTRAFISIHSGTIEGIYDELINLKHEFENTEKAKESVEIEMQNKKIRLEKAECSHAEYEARNEALKENIDSWYASRGVKDKEGYLSKKNRYSYLCGELDRINENVRKIMIELDHRDIKGLQTECERKLKIMDEEFIPSSGIGENEFNAKKMYMKKLDDMLNIKNRRREEMEKILAGHAENVRINFINLPEEILESMRELEQIEKKLSDVKLTKKAAYELKDLFSGMAAGSDNMLKELSAEMKKRFSEMLPGMRDISIEALDIGGISVMDKGGAMRRIDRLSRGTRESFLFAARLLFAVKSNGSSGAAEKRTKNIILLDEAFSSFDVDRVKSSLEMLDHFVVEFNCQIVIFTKEKRIVDESKKVFGEKVLVHEL